MRFIFITAACSIDAPLTPGLHYLPSEDTLFHRVQSNLMGGTLTQVDDSFTSAHAERTNEKLMEVSIPFALSSDYP